MLGFGGVGRRRSSHALPAPSGCEPRCDEVRAPDQDAAKSLELMQLVDARRVNERDVRQLKHDRRSGAERPGVDGLQLGDGVDRESVLDL